MVHVVLGIAALVFGVATALFTARLLRFEVGRSPTAEGAMALATALALCAAVMGFDPPMSGLAVLSLGIVASIVSLVVQRWGQLPLLRPVVAAMVGTIALVMAIHQAMPDRPPAGVVGPITILHITATLVGYVLFVPAFVLGNLYVTQIWRLKTKQPSSTRLPSLGTLETNAWRLLTVGFILYTLGVVGGWVSTESVHQAFRPQHVFAGLSWLIYAVALVRRYFAGWRGVRAAVTLMAGFVVTSGAVLLYVLR